MWRVYFFNEQMEIVEVQDLLRTKRACHSYAISHVKQNGYYTYAIGAIR
jgi:hypothetical protein